MEVEDITNTEISSICLSRAYLNTLKPLGEISTYASSYSVSYSHTDPSIACSCDELGHIYIIKATDSCEINSMMNLHNNSIFHVGWSYDDQFIVTGSGDQTGGVWDIEKEVGSILSKHSGSVKCIKNSPVQPNVYTTASRDGRIYIWDLRVQGISSSKNTIFEPIGEINQTAEIKPKRRKEPASFTGFEYLSWGNVIVSVQADESEMRFWDIRKTEPVKDNKKQRRKKLCLGKVGPWTWNQKTRLNELTEDRSKEKISSIKCQNLIERSGPGNSWISSNNNSLLVSSMGNSLYLYKNLLLIDSEPPIKFVGLRSSFYVKGCLSPDGDYVASGSSDGCLYIWELNNPEEPIVLQTGYLSELSCVDWTYGNNYFIATTLDASVLMFWDQDLTIE